MRGIMKFFLILIIVFFNTFSNAEILYYKTADETNQDYPLMEVNFPEECPRIIEINNDQSLQFKNKDAIKKKISECNIYLKGKKVKDTFKSGSDKILDSSIKVKDGIQKGLKSGTKSITESFSKETSLFIDDTIKLKDGIVGGTSKIINGTIDTGEKITSGVSTFFKGIFSSEK